MRLEEIERLTGNFSVNATQISRNPNEVVAEKAAEALRVAQGKEEMWAFHPGEKADFGWHFGAAPSQDKKVPVKCPACLKMDIANRRVLAQIHDHMMGADAVAAYQKQQAEHEEEQADSGKNASGGEHAAEDRADTPATSVTIDRSVTAGRSDSEDEKSAQAGRAVLDGRDVECESVTEAGDSPPGG